MDYDLNTILEKRHKLICKIMSDTDNKKFYQTMNNLLIKKYFDNAYELTLTENILRVNVSDLSKKDIEQILENFYNSVDDNTILKKRNLFELVKLSTLPQSKLKRYLKRYDCEKIGDYLDKVSRETTYISQDFLIVRIYQNFIIKNLIYKNNYNVLIKNLFRKICLYEYNKETHDNENTYLCWIDSVLSALMNREISIDKFVLILNRILNLTNHTIYLYWKILNTVAYLLLQKEFSANIVLRSYKNEIEKIINTKYMHVNITPDELQNLLLNTLSKPNCLKEDYYYLFDLITITAQSAPEHKLFCLTLCNYLLHTNKERQIFNHRFIRKYFIDDIFSFIEPNDDVEVSGKEIQFLIRLFHTDSFFCFDRTNILNYIIIILKRLCLNNIELNYNNFYKYCDILDYILVENPDLYIPNIAAYIGEGSSFIEQIEKHFILCKYKDI